MLAVVKAPHIEIRADVIPPAVLAFLKALYGHVTVHKDQTHTVHSVPWGDTDLAKQIRHQTTPAESLAVLRDTYKLTLAQLSTMTGVPSQNLSAMEKGRRTISKDMAARLAKAFGTGPELFYFYSAPASLAAEPKVKYSTQNTKRRKPNT
jgi:plasmid maintenance system antidote protein VapI